MKSRHQPVLDYIGQNLGRAIYRDEPGKGAGGVDLPYPYAAGSIKGEGQFTQFFYWDTPFTNMALLRCGHAEIAQSNIQNMLWLIKRQGYVPNYVGLRNRSQPPYLCRGVKDYFAHLGGAERAPVFFRECAEGLRQEYHFWMTARLHGTGLNQYGQHDTWEGQVRFARKKRVAVLCPSEGRLVEEQRRIGAHFMAEAESGHDFTPRFQHRCLDFVQPELNALLYDYELFFAEHARQLGWNDGMDWFSFAAKRKALIQKHLWSEERGFYFDYDAINTRLGDVPSLAGLQLLAHGIPTPEQAARMVANLPWFERAHGLAFTAEVPGCRNYQWAYPAVWPPMVQLAVEGLGRYGYRDDARRIAKTFVDTTARLFEKTGRLWEKTDAETGDVVNAEYDSVPMLGWTAGAFLALHEFLVGTAQRPGVN